jgi:hypothetical protein
LNEYPNVARDLLFKAITTGIFGSALPQELQDFFSKYHIDKIRDYGYVSYSDTDLQEIVGAVRSNVIEGQKIILVPHSQGNLYANAAYASLTTGANAISTNMIKIVGIASPGAYIAGDGSYLTSSNDVVISSLRSSGLSVLNSNIAVSVTIDDILGHSMRDVYLNENREGRAKFIEMLHASMDALSSSGVQAGQGPITVTLTWGSERDVDLHVFEPDGNHVYYGNKFGTVGLLDLDDTTSYGPEHYFTTCDNLRTGTYKIGVNYFYGLLPEKATVTISIPSGLSTRTVNLPTSFGSAGNDNPIMVGTIDVTKNSEGKYAFDLH